MRQDGLDRAAHLRTDEHLERVLSDPTTVLVAVWRGKSLVTTDADPRACLPTVADAGAWLRTAEHCVYLGHRDDRSYVMIDLPRADDPIALLATPIGGAFADLRFAAVNLPYEDFELLGYARGMADFHRSHPFDARTGEPTRPTEAGFSREPGGGGDKVFPRTDPAVMILLTRGDRCLLARGPRFPPGMFSALAGFVEPGESLEDCVAREVAEEVGLTAGPPRYAGSQAWPFPRSLMIGFVAEANEGEVAVDGVEIEEARWFSRAELRSPEGFFIPPPFSLSHRLIQGFVDAPIADERCLLGD